jgi:hypothetical protein
MRSMSNFSDSTQAADRDLGDEQLVSIVVDLVQPSGSEFPLGWCQGWSLPASENALGTLSLRPRWTSTMGFVPRGQPAK